MEKRYDHKQSEQEAQKIWAAEQTYTAENNPGQLYSIDTPPPSVSGTLHIGHIFSYTQTDILVRYKRMNGFSVFYPFGFDNNGLPTERFVEKNRKIKAHQLSRSEFIKTCLEETKLAEKEFTSLWQRMGLSVDWRNSYSTISDSVRKISQQSFIELYKKGFVYRKEEPALYCITCRTSVAQAELDDKELPSFFNDIVFKDEMGNDLIIGTTRPELLPSCVALFFNPNDTRYQHLKSTLARVPLFDFNVPVIEDERVDIEKGTGLVMCCTFGDKTDIEWYKKFNLPYKQSIGFDGKFTKATGFLEGLKAEAARKKIIEELIKNNLLIRQKEITHSVNVHERCGKEIEFTVLSQWFINILEHKQTFLDLADQINWHPEFMKARYKNWVENLGWDWCISRQRFYGVPFPVWHCNACQEILLANQKDLPVDPQELPYPGKQCTKCESIDIIPDTDVMDTWNTSSLTPYICYTLFKKNSNPFTDEQVHEFIPMGMRPQAHDIIRTWAFYTIVKTWMHHGIIPWKEIVISGHALSDERAKISKSKEGTRLTPENLLKQYPADVIRYWTASGRLGYDISFSESQLKIGQRLVTKIWNAFRFAHPHIEGFKPATLPETLGTINEWALHTISTCFEQYKKYFEQHEFSLALDKIEQFFWNNFCDNYLELIKNQLFNPENYTTDQIYATKWTLHNLGLRILQMYSPYLPHLTETIYRTLYLEQHKTSSIHQTNFQELQQEYVFEESTTLTNKIIVLISQVRKLKTEQQLSLKIPLTSLTIYSEDDTLLDQIKQHEQLIAGITQAENITYKTGKLDTPELKDRDDVWHAQVTTV